MKRIIICCDGTWNRPDRTEGDVPVATNVVKIAEAVMPSTDDGIAQKLYYDPGVGTSGHLLRRMYDGATGSGLKQNIIEAYRYLIDLYEPGDQLFFFGFSRGAYTVRRAAGLIRNCGVLRRESREMIDQAYRLYTSNSAASHPALKEATLFRRTYAVEDITPIHFIGVWDTVGTKGNPLIYNFWTHYLFFSRNNFHDTLLSTKVKNAYQALAIDEKRFLFNATLWNQQANAGGQTLQQAWFAGVHSNIGGGYTTTGLSDIALNWMAEKASMCGLKLEPIVVHPDPREKCRESRKWFYLLWFPRYRKIAKPKPDEGLTCEAVHQSAKSKYRDDPTYRPKNLEDYFTRFPDQRP